MFNSKLIYFRVSAFQLSTAMKLEGKVLQNLWTLRVEGLEKGREQKMSVNRSSPRIRLVNIELEIEMQSLVFVVIHQEWVREKGTLTHHLLQ